MTMQATSARRPFRWALLSLISVPGLGIAQQAATQPTAPASTATAATSAGAGSQTFDTPEQAADAFVAAADKFDVAALEKILGPGQEDLVTSGDAVQDRKRAAQFAAQAREKKSVSIDPKNPDHAVLIVGKEDWPAPIPIVKHGGKWSFDAAAGRDELLRRRIGGNELDAIEICRGYVEAQYDYAFGKREGYEVNQFAQRIISTPGKHDGLAWREADGTLGGPIGERIADAIEEGYTTKSQPYHGYYFKVLKGQGPAAPHGAMDFVVKGVMIGGFALVAAPAEYGSTGIKTFIVSHSGVVYEKDLGPNTLEEFRKMQRFNPDKTWTPVKD
jgi:hypothetical protein